MYRGKFSSDMVPRTVLETLEHTLSSTSITAWRTSTRKSVPSSRASSFSGAITPQPPSRRRSSIPMFRRRANYVVRLFLVFLAIPTTLYLFATSRSAKLRKEALLEAFLADPARIGRWPEWLHVPVTAKRTAGHSDRQQSRRSENQEEGDLDGWQQWQSDGQISFWGNADVVGPSPFDHVPKQLKDGDGKRVMFLTGEFPALYSSGSLTRSGRLPRLPRANEYPHLRNRGCRHPTSACLPP